LPWFVVLYEKRRVISAQRSVKSAEQTEQIGASSAPVWLGVFTDATNRLTAQPSKSLFGNDSAFNQQYKPETCLSPIPANHPLFCLQALQ
jgi:hypothetical protein